MFLSPTKVLHQLMDNTAQAPERAAQQATSAEPPRGWVEAQAELATTSGLSLLLVEGREPPSICVANNNSICQAFQSSPAHAHLCQPDCGEAYFRALEAGGAVNYRCHAGLHCFATPVRLGDEKELAVIGGRCFLRVADYRALAERIRAGDLTDLLSADLFGNVIFASRQDLEDLAARVAEAEKSYARPRRKVKDAAKQDPSKAESSSSASPSGASSIAVDATRADATDAEAQEQVAAVASNALDA